MTKMVQCKLNGEHEIILPEHRANREEWYSKNGWEKKRLEHMKRILKKAMSLCTLERRKAICAA